MKNSISDLYSNKAAAANNTTAPDPATVTLFKPAELPGVEVGEPPGLEIEDGGTAPSEGDEAGAVGGAGGEVVGVEAGGETVGEEVGAAEGGVTTAGGGAETGDLVGVAVGEAPGA